MKLSKTDKRLLEKAQWRKVERLISTVDKRAQPPRGFAFYSPGMMLCWLHSHQVKG